MKTELQRFNGAVERDSAIDAWMKSMQVNWEPSRISCLMRRENAGTTGNGHNTPQRLASVWDSFVCNRNNSHTPVAGPEDFVSRIAAPL
jgi:hypothetical protein